MNIKKFKLSKTQTFNLILVLWIQIFMFYEKPYNYFIDKAIKREDFQQAIYLVKQVIFIKKLPLGAIFHSLDNSYNDLAYIYIQQEKYKEAEGLLNQAISVNNDILYCRNLALFYKNQGKYKKSEKLYKKIISRIKKKSKSKKIFYATSNIELASLYIKMLKYQKAEVLLNQSISMIQEFRSHSKITVIYLQNALINLGRIYQESGEYEKAKIYYNKSLEYSNNSVIEKLILVPLYIDMKNYKKSEDIINKAIIELKKYSGKKEFYIFLNSNQGLSYCYNYIALIYQKKNNYKKAEEYYKKAIEILKNTGNQEFKAKLHNNLSFLYLKKNNHQNAINNLNEAIEIYKKLFDNDHPDKSCFTNNLSSVKKLQGDEEESKKLNNKALKIIEKEFLTDKAGFDYILKRYCNNLRKDFLK